MLGVEHALEFNGLRFYPLCFRLHGSPQRRMQGRRRQHAEKRPPLSSTAIQPAFHCNISPNARRRLSPRFTQASMRRA